MSLNDPSRKFYFCQNAPLVTIMNGSSIAILSYRHFFSPRTSVFVLLSSSEKFNKADGKLCFFLLHCTVVDTSYDKALESRRSSAPSTPVLGVRPPPVSSSLLSDDAASTAASDTNSTSRFSVSSSNTIYSATVLCVCFFI